MVRIVQGLVVLPKTTLLSLKTLCVVMFSSANYQRLGFSGFAARQRTMPEFEDILQYLDYMKLDEPIIGE